MGAQLPNLILLAFILFTLGVLGVIIRRNILIILMSIELMLNAVNLSFVTFSRYLGDDAGHIMVLMIYVVAAVEVAVAVAIIINMFKLRRTVSVDGFSELKG
jgi:NADH-quinone oxidoreductase subunit K